MNPDLDQSDLFPEFSPSPQMVFVNDAVSLQNEADQRIILVHGVVYSHYSREDRTAEAYALVKQYESGYADQNDLARSFGYPTRTLRSATERFCASRPKISDSPSNQIPLSVAPPLQRQEPVAKTATQSFDLNPLNRSMDRLLAALGQLDDARPLFAPAQNLPRAGVLLAIPALVASGLVPVAEKIYGSLHPSFYGLRTTLVAYVLLALLRIPLPEALKEYPPGGLAASWG
jgi:hypothetical protein